MNRFFCFLVVSQLVASVVAQSPVDIKCYAESTLVWENEDNTPCTLVEHVVFYSENFLGPYDSLGAVTNPNQEFFEFLDPLPLGESFLYIESTYLCGTAVVLVSDTISSLPPDLVEISFLDVTDAGIIVNWDDQLNDPNDHDYVIYRSTPSGINALDTVSGVNFYLDEGVFPVSQSEIYYVLALNDCGNVSIFDTGHSSMFMSAEFTSCGNSFDVTYNLMEDASDELDSLKIFVEHESGFSEFILVDPNSTMLQYEILSGGGEYCFEMFAYYPDGYIATSNRICLFAAVLSQLSTYGIYNVSTLDNEIVIDWMAEDINALKKLELLGYNLNGDFVWSSGVSDYSLGASQSYSDFENSGSELVLYEVNFIDGCDSIFKTERFSNLVLSIQDLGAGQLELSWSSIFPDYINIFEYRLYKVNGNSEEFVGAFDATSSSTIIELSANELKSNELEFVLKRIADASSLSIEYPYVISTSNKVSYNPSIKLVFPNAISPYGKNDEFKPVLVSGVVEAYSMAIYDRYGKRLYTSDDIATGWGGKSDLDYFPSGVYHFVVSVLDSQGVDYEYSGMLTLVK